MKPFLIALVLSGCTAVEVVEVPVEKHRLATRPDPAAAMMLKCDALGFLRDSDGHRLCVMRGVDRLGIEHYRPQASAPIRILPHPYPPLAPQGKSLFIYP